MTPHPQPLPATRKGAWREGRSPRTLRSRGSIRSKVIPLSNFKQPTQFRVLAARSARALPIVSRPKIRGRRECRMRAAPAVSCANLCKKRTRAYRFSGGNPTFPAQWLYGLYRDLPGDQDLFVTVAPRMMAGLTPGWAGFASSGLDANHEASGPHDFAVRISTVRLRAWQSLTVNRPAIALARRRCRVHRIPPQRP